jgi:hypothetical protein
MKYLFLLEPNTILYDSLAFSFGWTFLFCFFFAINYFIKSEAIKKSLTKEKYAIVLLVVIIGNVIISYSNHPAKYWTKEKEQNFRDKFKEIADTMGMPFSPVQKEQMCDCALSGFEKRFPNGLTPDSAVTAGRKLGMDCSLNIMSTQPLAGWNNTIETLLYNQVMINPSIIAAIPDGTKRSEFSTCCVNEIKAQYPNGLYFPDLKNKLSAIELHCAQIMQQNNQ